MDIPKNQEIKVGQIWRDKDPRLVENKRDVTITKVDDSEVGFVYYTSNRGVTSRSWIKRFRKAFQLLSFPV